MKTLTPSLRRRLKKPLGILVPGPPEIAVKGLKEFVLKEKPSKTIAVGDIVSQTLHKGGVEVNLYLTDNKVMRKETCEASLEATRVLSVVNRPGTIAFEAVKAIEEALKEDGPVRIMVEGEEDLLTLPSILAAPLNSIVVYGQPGEGIVIVKTTREKKEEIQRLVEAMPNETLT